MAKAMKLTVAVACVGILAGCSIEGTWKTTSVEPEQYMEKFMLSTVTFDDGMYTGTITREGKESTSTGEYEWNGMFGCLKIMPKDCEPREYKGWLWWGKKLVLHHEYEGEKLTGVMEKQCD